MVGNKMSANNEQRMKVGKIGFIKLTMGYRRYFKPTILNYLFSIFPRNLYYLPIFFISQFQSIFTFALFYDCCYYCCYHYLMIILIDVQNIHNIDIHIKIDLMLQPRHKLHHKIRTSQIQKHLQCQRQQQMRNYNKELEQQFMRHFPLITTQTYTQHKTIIATVVWNTTYSYQISCISDIVCWFVMEECYYDRDSIKILKYISQYQQTTVPQSQQMSQALLKIMKGYQQQEFNDKMQLDGFIITANLASTGRNGLLINKIIQSGFIDLVAHLIQTDTIKDKESYQQMLALASEILCTAISSHPPLTLPLLSSLCTLMNSLCQISPQSTWCLIASLSQLRKTHKPNKKIAQILLSQFCCLLLKQKHGCELQIMDFLIYAANSQVCTNNDKMLLLIQQCGLGIYGIPAQTSALDCGNMYKQNQWQTEIWSSCQIWQIFISTNINQILQTLCLLSPTQMMEGLQQQQQQEIQKILDKLIQLLQIRQNEDKVCDILFILLEQRCVRVQLIAYGLKKVVDKIMAEKGGHDCDKLEQILELLEEHQTI